MKKYLMFFGVLSLSLFSFGQVYHHKPQYTWVKGGDKNYGQNSIDKFLEKGGGDVFWSTSFDWKDPDNPSGWSLPDGWTIVDETDFGAPWVWRDDTLGSFWNHQPAPDQFDTPEDGFIAFPAEEYLTRDEVIHYEETYHSHITTAGIDCSDHSSVVVSLNHIFKLCCNQEFGIYMLVSIDDGVHWSTYDLRHGISANNTLPARYRHENINISNLAAGMPNIQIRFLFVGPSAYFWMIDDLRLMEAYDNELVLDDYWSYFYVSPEEDEGHINYLPLSQFGNEAGGGKVGEYSFKMSMLNNGLEDQYNARLQMTVEKNGEQVYQELSDATTLWMLDRDTVSITENKFMADGYGDYNFTFDAISENVDEVPENNTASLMFTLNDTLMHRADFSAEDAANGGGWFGGPNSGDIIGTVYHIFNPTEINSITAYLMENPDAEEGYNYNNTTYMFHLMKYFEEEDIYISIITSEMASMDSSQIESWVTLPMVKDGESEYLEPGFYVAAVEMLGGTGNGMAVGWDKDTKFPQYATYLFLNGDEPFWFNNGKLAQIGMNLNEAGGPREAPVTFNVDMNAHIANGEFIPGSDFVDIAGSFNAWNGSDALTDEDGDGIHSITLENFTIGNKIEFKYRINASWETSEFPNGGPNRTYTIRYWNVLDNVYNGGKTTGLEKMPLLEEFSVYPNPASSDFTLSIGTRNHANYKIRLLDIMGNEVYQNYVKSTFHHTEIIKNNFARGVYYLTVNIEDDQIVKKVVIN